MIAKRQILLVLLLSITCVHATSRETHAPRLNLDLEIPGRDDLISIQRLIIKKDWESARRRLIGFLKTTTDSVIVQAAVRLSDQIPNDPNTRFAFEKAISSLEIGTVFNVDDVSNVMDSQFFLRAKIVDGVKLSRVRIRSLSSSIELLDSHRNCDGNIGKKSSIECLSKNWHGFLASPGLYEINVDSSVGPTTDVVVLNESAIDLHPLTLKQPAQTDSLTAPNIPYEVVSQGRGNDFPDEIRLSLVRSTTNVIPLTERKWTAKNFVPSGVLEAPSDGGMILHLNWKTRTAAMGACSVHTEGNFFLPIYLSKAHR